jgi:hypothetical protein
MDQSYIDKNYPRISAFIGEDFTSHHDSEQLRKAVDRFTDLAIQIRSWWQDPTYNIHSRRLRAMLRDWTQEETFVELVSALDWLDMNYPELSKAK